MEVSLDVKVTKSREKGYPQAGSDVYSVSRFLDSDFQKTLPEQVKVGGRFYSFQEWDCLLSSHGCILLPKNFSDFFVNQVGPDCSPNSNLNVGDLLVITFYRGDIAEASTLGMTLFQTSSDGCPFADLLNQGGKIFDLSEVQNVERVFETSGELKEFSEKKWIELCKQSKAWSEFIFAVRKFFHYKKFIEVNSPGLVTNPGMEPELEPFSWNGKWVLK